MAAPVKRQYLDGKGKKLPSVTEILGNLGWKYQVLIHWANKVGRQGLTMREASGDAAKVGSIAHDRIEAFVNGGLLRRTTEAQDLWDRSTVAFESFLTWYDANGYRIQVIETECLMTDQELGYGGTADLVCLLDGVPAILDYKTGSGIYPEVAVQLEAYCTLWETVGHAHETRSDGTPISIDGRKARRACHAISTTGVIHCPADGRATQLIVIPSEMRRTAGKIWDILLAMNSHKAEWDDFGDWLKSQEIPKDDESSEGGTGTKVPF